MVITLNRKQKERLFRLLEKGNEALAYWWNCEMDGEKKDAVEEVMRLRLQVEEMRETIGMLEGRNLELKAENLKLKKQIDPNYNPIKQV